MCDELNPIEHALSCKKGGFINNCHDNIRDLLTTLLNGVCTNVQAGPHITRLTGEQFAFRTANTSSEARLDIKARNLWRKGEDAQVRVTHANFPSYRPLPLSGVSYLRTPRKRKEERVQC